MIYQSSELHLVVDSAVGTMAREVEMVPPLLVAWCNGVVALEVEGAVGWRQGESWKM